MELREDEMPPDAHVARTVVEVDVEELDVFRRNAAYGGVTARIYVVPSAEALREVSSDG